MALCAPFISNDVPIVANTVDGFQIPFLDRNRFLIKQPDILWSLDPMLSYHSETQGGSKHLLNPPLHNGHLLGSDAIGRDTFAGILYGLRTALLVALIAVLGSGIMGLLIGGVVGYFGNNRLYLSKSRTALVCFILLIGFFVQWRLQVLSLSIIWTLLLWVTILVLIVQCVSRNSSQGKLPMDRMVMMGLEWYESIPSLIILMFLAHAYQGLSSYGIGLFIAALLSPYMIRIVRAEVIKTRDRAHIIASRAFNKNFRHILFEHFFPLLWKPMQVIAAFSIGSSILLEASLSFLGLGLPGHTVTLGSMINEARSTPQAYWLMLFPGLVIYGLVLLGLSTRRQKV